MVNEEEIAHYRQNVIKKYVTAVMEKLKREELIHKFEERERNEQRKKNRYHKN